MKKFGLALFGLISTLVFAEGNSVKIVKLTNTIDEVTKVEYIEGDVLNQSSQLIDHAVVKINFYENGALVGNSVATISDLDVGKVWHFKAAATVKFDRFDIVDILTY